MHLSQQGIKQKYKYNNIKTALEKVDYDYHYWLICVDLKTGIFALTAKWLYNISMSYLPMGEPSA